VSGRCTTLQVPKDVVPGVTDLAGEQPNRIDFGVVVSDETKGSRQQQGAVGAFQVRPVALSFSAKYPASGLQAVANLAACETAGGVVTTFGRACNRDTERIVDIPALAGGPAAAVVSQRVV